MTSSGSCSSRPVRSGRLGRPSPRPSARVAGGGRRKVLALATLAVLGCGHTRASAPPAVAWVAEIGRRPRIAVFPVQNLTGGRAPMKLITEALRHEVEASGFDNIAGDAVDRVLA